MGANTIEITDGNFESEVVKSNTPVLVDFWAAWCAPCRAIAPTIDAIAEEYKGRVKVGKLDVDANLATVSGFGFVNTSLDRKTNTWPMTVFCSMFGRCTAITKRLLSRENALGMYVA